MEAVPCRAIMRATIICRVGAAVPRGFRHTKRNVRSFMNRPFELTSSVSRGEVLVRATEGDSSLVRGMYMDPTTIAANDERSGRSSGRRCEF